MQFNGAAQGPSGNIELGYADISALYTAANSTIADVPGLSITITEGSRPYIVEFSCQGFGTSVTAVNVNILLTDGANTQLAAATMMAHPTANGGVPGYCKARIANPTPGTSKTYKIRLNNGGATGAPFINAGTTGRAILQASEV